MPRIIRIGVDISQGHGHLPCPVLAPLGKRTVFVNKILAAAVGDLYNEQLHIPPPLQPRHIGMAAAIGSVTVFINNKPAHRDGDLISCGDVADNGSNTVFCNGGGGGGPATKKDPRETTGYVVGVPNLHYSGSLLVFNYLTDENQEYIDGCFGKQVIEEVYSPLIEEESNVTFKNYPGLPRFKLSGASLPPYAPQVYRQPIAISQFSLNLPLPDGLTFNSETGEISGKVTREGLLHPDYLYVISCTNIVGKGSFQFRVTFNPVKKCV